MSSRKPLSRLREIRDARRQAEKLGAKRDELIRKAIEEGHSERQIAHAIGLTPGRINQIARCGD